jgi:oligoendopeptidase F
MVMNPYIRDLEGQLIEVTDLQEAITQTAAYIGILYQQQDPTLQAFAKKRQLYWKDIFQKLGRLKSKVESIESTQVLTGGSPSINKLP